MTSGEQTLEHIENMSTTPRSEWSAPENELAGTLVNMSIKEPLDYSPQEINMLDNVLEAQGQQTITGIAIANASADLYEKDIEFIVELLTSLIGKMFGSNKTMEVDGAEHDVPPTEAKKTSVSKGQDFISQYDEAAKVFAQVTRSLDLTVTPRNTPQPEKSNDTGLDR